ncbi:MAG: hypothetical protein RBG13Loki_3771, partial [Promethearchaeota archaeon CR_4]
SGAQEMCFRNGTSDEWTAWEPYSTTKQVYLGGSTNNNEYTIQVKFRNLYGGESAIVEDSILYLIQGGGDGNDGDYQKPRIPGYPLEYIIIGLFGVIGISLGINRKKRLMLNNERLVS